MIMSRLFKALVPIAFGIALLPVQQAISATTGLNFAGGCPQTTPDSLCGGGANATTTNVAAILGINESDVSQISGGFTITPPSGTTNGDWSVSDTSIDYIAFKANGYFVLGEVNAVSGTWDLVNPVTTWGTDVSLLCPLGICTDGARAYVDADFLNNGGNVADLSNTRAFSVSAVPVPAAVWLFGSGLLGLVGVARRKKQ